MTSTRLTGTSAAVLMIAAAGVPPAWAQVSEARIQELSRRFVDRMVEKGYTEKQVRLLCEWYLRVRKSS